ncbi:hypothetical protein BCR43DRAFT_497922 [Syncephalastrum racemosum]|uniref:Uncharacterized protein n=1 Tax=Syncephalastrum racemosum TaxID=13706 RepID=A0A1X2H357_SYNRA|nr:hypothetical protein BCR43DRAFT_497922 [Syncephalastrum racemosum]
MESSFLQLYCQHCCPEGRTIDNVSLHVATKHWSDVVVKVIRPPFQVDKDDPDPAWLRVENGYDAVTVLAWAVNHGPADQVLQLVPYVLRILDTSSGISVRLRAIHILCALIQKVPGQEITKRGLHLVFFDTLNRHLQFVTEDKDIPIASLAYDCVMNLIDKTTETGGQNQVESYVKVLDAILGALIYVHGKPRQAAFLYSQLPRIYSRLGAVGIRYLKVLVEVLCDTIERTPHNESSADLRALSIAAIVSLKVVIQNGRPCVPRYRGRILAAISAAWIYYYKERKDEPVYTLLRELMAIFQGSIGEDVLQADKQELLDFDRESFSVLFA